MDQSESIYVIYLYVDCIMYNLQCSPWGSPRILSPVDVRHILSSRSSENLVMLGLGSPAPSPVKRRWTRRSLRRQRSPSAHSAQRANQQEEAEKLLRDTEDELRLRLEAITQRQRCQTILANALP